jgi:hypothetical protein
MGEILKNNVVCKVCKVSAIIIFTISLVGGVYLNQRQDKLSFIIAIALWIGSFIYCLFLFVIGEIINLLHHIKNNSSENITEISKLQMTMLGIRNEIVRIEDRLKNEKELYTSFFRFYRDMNFRLLRRIYEIS